MFKNTKGIVAPVLLFFLASVGLIVYFLLSSSMPFKDKLFSMLYPKPTSHAASTRGQSGDLWADIVLGKSDFSEITPNTVVPGKVFAARSVIVDRGSNKLYVYDGGNSRVLGFDLQKCLASSINPLNCTPDLIIGQQNGYSSACNGDSGYQDYPNKAPASAAVLCGLQEAQLSVTEGGSASNMYVDSQGNLYLTDFWNNRVLKYNSPFTTDTVADDVWGQVDFSSKNCNKGQTLPDASTLCLSPWSGNNNWAAGVEIDVAGNVWVADAKNNRVLRFPQGSKTADLVLGQLDFNSKASGGGLNQFYGPAAVRVTANGVYVADEGNNRVLFFSGTLSNGISGAVFGSGFALPTGLDVDPAGAGIWVANRNHHTYELWSEGTSSALIKTLGTRDNGNVLNNATGSLGIDSNGNYFVAVPGADFGGDIVMFPVSGPYNVPSKRLLGGFNVFNQRDSKGIYSGNGIALYEGQSSTQMVVMDGVRLMFWNDLSALTNGKNADGVAEITDFSKASPNGGFTVIKASKNNLYVGRTKHILPARIEIYSLPLTSGAKFVKYLTLPLPVLGGGEINFPSSDSDPHLWGIVPTQDDQFLWVADTNNSRVFRIRGPLTANPVVDIILGQTDPSRVLCNQTGSYNGGNSETAANNLCYPGSLSLDKQGNLYVSDHSLEIRGNMRLLEFNANLFPADNSAPIYAPNASKIFPRIATWEPAFDSRNRMVVGYNPYWTPNPKGGWFTGVYNNPLTSLTPDNYLNDYYSMGFASVFDSSDNLYVGDLDRSRILIYKKPFVIQSTPTSAPTVTTTPTPTPTPAPTPTQDTQLPTVNITFPTNGSFLKKNSNITITATASDNIGVSKVEFYAGSNLLCSDTTIPYSCSWSIPKPPRVTYTITAKAFDVAGNSAKNSTTVTSK